jgi:hypothetical protein
MDISTIEGLFDLIAVGCLVELSHALDEYTYINVTIPDDELEEIRHMHGLGGYAQITDTDKHRYEYGYESGYPFIRISISADPCLDLWISQTIYFAQKQ